MHQNILLPKDIFSLKKIYAITFLSLKWVQTGFYGDLVKVVRVFYIFILPLLNEIIFFIAENQNDLELDFKLFFFIDSCC